MPFFNPDICFSYCSPTCSQERWEKRSGQATNEQVGWFYIYISNRSTHRTKPAFGCRKGPQQLREGAAACLPGLFLRGSQRESLRLENRSQQSDTEPAATWGAPQQPALREFEPNNSLHSPACTIDQLGYFNKLSPFLIVSSLFMRSVIQRSFAGKRWDLSIPPSK